MAKEEVSLAALIKEEEEFKGKPRRNVTKKAMGVFKTIEIDSILSQVSLND